MRTVALIVVLALTNTLVYAQDLYQYRSSDVYPFGQPHPDAPKEITDYGPLIGISDCKSIARISPTDWADTIAMEWHFKYIMNGWGVQDETYKTDGVHSGSIRQYNADSAQWYVTYYSSSTATPSLTTWAGDPRDGGDFILYAPQKAPNGMDGFFKIRFSEISNKGFKWEGAWVDPAEAINYATWKIYCKKRVD